MRMRFLVVVVYLNLWNKTRTVNEHVLDVLNAKRNRVGIPGIEPFEKRFGLGVCVQRRLKIGGNFGFAG
jgi:hypothetical protein